jgi:rubrerythrin
MIELSPTMPKNATEASTYIYTVKSPTLEDFKVMVLLEAAGQGFYRALSDAAPTDAIKALLGKSGQEELGHAHRVSRVIKLLFGQEFPPPEPNENPYYMMPQGLVLSQEMLDGITQGEIGGEALYEGWASSIGNEEAARLLRQNGKEERGHGDRAQEAKRLLAS